MAQYLPLRILFFEDANGQTWATYDDPAAFAPTHGLTADHPAVLAIQGALLRFAAIATGQWITKTAREALFCVSTVYKAFQTFAAH